MDARRTGATMRHGASSPSNPMDRRAFLRLSGQAAAGVASASLLAACTGTGERPSQGPAIGAGVRNPITLPLSAGNPAIESGLPTEKHATLKIFEWREYLSHSVVEDFAKTHDIDYQITSFENRDKG